MTRRGRIRAYGRGTASGLAIRHGWKKVGQNLKGVARKRRGSQAKERKIINPNEKK